MLLMTFINKDDTVDGEKMDGNEMMGERTMCERKPVIRAHPTDDWSLQNDR